jgi:hypothetical protein
MTAKPEAIPTLNEPTLLPILTTYFDRPVDAVSGWHISPLRPGSGLASGGPFLVSGQAEVNGGPTSWTVVLKLVRAPVGSRYDREAQRESHWAYWRREPLAYASGLLANLQGLRAPRCYGIVEQEADPTIWLWLEAVQGVAPPQTAPALGLATRTLGRFNGAGPNDDNQTPPNWLARRALRSRIERLAQDAGPDGFADLATWRDPRVRQALPDEIEPAMVFLWQNRTRLLDQLDALPQVIVHGDANPGNLLLPQPPAAGDTPIAVDWSNMGLAALGSDPADLFVWAILGHGDIRPDYTPDAAIKAYCAGLVDVAANFTKQAAAAGFLATAALMAAARLHWFVNRALKSAPSEPTLAAWQPAAAVIVELADKISPQHQSSIFTVR